MAEKISNKRADRRRRQKQGLPTQGQIGRATTLADGRTAYRHLLLLLGRVFRSTLLLP
jgi:hypothetical protein